MYMSSTFAAGVGSAPNQYPSLARSSGFYYHIPKSNPQKVLIKVFFKFDLLFMNRFLSPPSRRHDEFPSYPSRFQRRNHLLRIQNISPHAEVTLGKNIKIFVQSIFLTVIATMRQNVAA